MKKELAYSFDGENYNCLDATTIKEAVKEVIDNIDFDDEMDCYGNLVIYIGEQVPYSEDKGSDCYDNVIDYFKENAYDEGGEYAEYYLDTISSEAEKFLKDGLDKLFTEFLKINNEKKNYYSLENCKEYQIYKDGTFMKVKEEN